MPCGTFFNKFLKPFKALAQCESCPEKPRFGRSGGNACYGGYLLDGSVHRQMKLDNSAQIWRQTLNNSPCLELPLSPDAIFFRVGRRFCDLVKSARIGVAMIVQRNLH